MSLYDVDYSDVVHKLMPSAVRDADFVTSNGDIAYGDTTEQDMYLILQSGTGNWYQYPRIGFNLQKKLNSSYDRVTFKQQVIAALQEDNIKVDDIQILTINDIRNLNITDSNLISQLQKNKIIISAKVSR